MRRLLRPLPLLCLVLFTLSGLVGRLAQGQPAPAPVAAAAPAPVAPALPGPAPAAPAAPGAPAVPPVGLFGDAPATQPATTQPTTQPAATQSTATLPPEPPAIKLPDGRVILNFKDARLESVLTFFAEASGLVIISEGGIDGRVNVISREPRTLEEAMGVLNTVLKDRGYTAIRSENTLKIVTLDAAKRANIPVRSGNLPTTVPATEEMFTYVIPIRYADAVALKRDLGPLIPAYADLSANASSNTLILTDTGVNVKRIIAIISSLDTAMSSVLEVKVFQLKYANATSAARLITDVFRIDQPTGAQGGRGGLGGALGRFFGGGGGGGGGPFGGGGGPGGGGGAPGGADPARQQPKVTASADDRTNTVVVSAPSDTMKVVEKVLHDLDSDPAQDQDVFTYPLKNANAANVAGVLNSLFGAGGTGGNFNRGSTTGTNTFRGGTSGSSGFGSGGGSSGFGSSSGRGSGGGGSSGFGSSSGRGGGGSGFGSGGGGSGFGGSGFGGAGGLSRGSSQSAASLSGQVYVVPDADTNSLMVLTSTNNRARVQQIIDELDRPMPQVLIKVLLAEVTHDDTVDLGVEFSAINLPNSGKTNVVTQFGNAAAQAASGGFMFSLIEDQVTASIRALEKVGKVDVLSRPYILASDNQLATITVGQTVPFVRNTQTTSTGEVLNTIQYQDIGIILNVLPHINPDGLVIMDVAPQISALTDSTVPISNGVSAPIYSNRLAQTHIAIRDGQTIVIGGLMQDRKDQTVNKVPIVGDIPLLGLLFQRNNTTKTKTELLIFLTPHVAQMPERLQPMSDDERKGAKVVPNAVDKGVFQEHMEGLQRGRNPENPGTPGNPGNLGNPESNNGRLPNQPTLRLAPRVPLDAPPDVPDDAGGPDESDGVQR